MNREMNESVDSPAVRKTNRQAVPQTYKPIGHYFQYSVFLYATHTYTYA